MTRKIKTRQRHMNKIKRDVFLGARADWLAKQASVELERTRSTVIDCLICKHLTTKTCLVWIDNNGGTATLATDTVSLTNLGRPVLVLRTAELKGKYGPADTITLKGDASTAASIVRSWAVEPGRSRYEIERAQLFLSQWPEGPQI